MYSYGQPYLLLQVRVQFPHSIVFMRPIKSLLVLVFARVFGNAVSAVRPWDRGWSGVGFEPTPTLLDQNALWQRINGASLETWDWLLRPLGQPRPQGLWADFVLEKALASADILHPKFWGVNKLRPHNFNARNCFILQNFLYLLLQDKVNVIYF
jgi:hypothetical protein